MIRLTPSPQAFSRAVLGGGLQNTHWTLFSSAVLNRTKCAVFPSGFLRRQAGHGAGVPQVPLLGVPGRERAGMRVRSRGGLGPGQWRRLRPRCHLQGTVPRDSVAASPERCHCLPGAVSVSLPPRSSRPAGPAGRQGRAEVCGAGRGGGTARGQPSPPSLRPIGAREPQLIPPLCFHQRLSILAPRVPSAPAALGLRAA